VASLATPHFSTLSHKLHDFRGGGEYVIEHKICVLIFSTAFSKTFLIQPDNVIDMKSSLCKVPVILVRF
jgi:hypothetical protein